MLGEDIKHTESGIPYRELVLDDGTFKLFNTADPARLKEETFTEYKIRRNILGQVQKAKLKGKQVWNSKMFGTYDKEKIKKILEDYKNKRDGEQINTESNNGEITNSEEQGNTSGEPTV